jgi:hypothetical protein
MGRPQPAAPREFVGRAGRTRYSSAPALTREHGGNRLDIAIIHEEA